MRHVATAYTGELLAVEVTLIRNILVLAALTSFSLWGAPVMYMTDGDQSRAFVVDLSTGTYLGSFPTFSLGYPLAIGDTVRIADRDNGTGYEYTLAGIPTGLSYTGGSYISQLLDGTTDGTTYNYAVQCCSATNSVVRADRLWQSTTPLFALPAGGSGIAYDPVDNTLWVSLFDSTVRHYDLSGQQLFSFNVPSLLAGFAYDSSTDTFWGYQNGSGVFYQFDRSGPSLQTLVVANMPGNNAWGGEIAQSAVPEPGSLLLLVAGAAALLLFRKRG